MNLKNQLKSSYVAFLDVLGFTNLVSSNEINRLENYFNLIKKELDGLGTNLEDQIDSLLISDSVILISPFSHQGFITLSKTIQNIQAALVLEDIWLRGAISFGEVCFDKNLNVVLGKGYINAYLLEKKADYPRVIVDAKIISEIGGTWIDFFQAVNPEIIPQTNNGKFQLIYPIGSKLSIDACFISYGHKLLHDCIKENKQDVIYNILLKRLYSVHEYYPKYSWVKDYFYSILWEQRFFENFFKNDLLKSEYFNLRDKIGKM